MFCVYKHTTPNGKVYIGITSQEVEKRWLNGKGYKKNSYFENAINKYGWKNIKHEVLLEGLTQEEAEQKEIELIKEYKATDRKYGYNICKGGRLQRLGLKHTKETRKKISENQKGRTMSLENRKKQSERLKGKAPLWCLPYAHTKEVEAKRRATNKKLGKLKGRFVGRKSPKARSVCMYDLDGNYIKTFYAFAEAQEEMKIDYSSIVKVCQGQRKTAGGYTWKYERKM